MIEFEVTVQCGARAMFASDWSTNFYIKFSIVGFCYDSQQYTLNTENFVDKPKTSFFTLVNAFFFQKKSAFISLSATFFYWWKTVLFFEISRKRALHHTVIILVFFSLPHLCPSMINWGKKLFQLISLLERIPSHFEFSFCMSEITKKLKNLKWRVFERFLRLGGFGGLK